MSANTNLTVDKIILRKDLRNEPLVDLNNQAIQLNDPSERFSAIVETGKYLLTCNREIETVLDCIYHGFQQSKENHCIGFRSPYSGVYEWLSYNQALFRMKRFGSGLINIGCQPSNTTLIGIFGKNNLKLLIAEYACYHYSMVVVPIFDTSESVVCQYILDQTEPKCVIVDSNERAQRILTTFSKQITFHSIILTCDHIQQGTAQLADKKNVKLYQFSDIENLGTENTLPLKIPRSTDLAVISYTSGSTGFPKGSLLTHANLVAAASGILLHLDPYLNLRSETMVSYLSMGHSFQRIIMICMFYSGGRIGIYTGDFKDLTRDLTVLQPTVMTCVPRIMNRIYNRVTSKVRGNWVAARLLDIALKSKQANPERKKNDSLWDSLAFKTVRQILGGNLKILISGAAQLSPTVLSFVRSAFGCIVIEGYCLTECSAFVTLTHCTDRSTGHLGPPLACNAVKLIDVPELNISTAITGIGEICVKGTNVFSGYYKNYEKFTEVMDDEGWLHTGDLGQWQQNGTLKVWNRKDHFIKLSTEQYVSPEKIENTYHQSRYVSQCFVEGDSSHSFLVGIIVPDIDSINLWCNDNSMIFSAAEACRNVSFKRVVLNDMRNIGRREGLHLHEQVKDIYLHSVPFSVESGLLTPTMKLKRHECRQYFKVQIEDMYRNNDLINVQTY